jgi:uncharacterized protein YcbK (DUF882 family)
MSENFSYATSSEHFSESEFACSHTGVVRMKPEFITVLEAVRVAYGKPMKLSSAFRDATHPVEARKGDRAGTGDHCRGVAVDVLVSGAAALELIKVAQECGIDRIGIAQKGNHSSRFVHLGISDSSAGKGPAIWSY